MAKSDVREGHGPQSSSFRSALPDRKTFERTLPAGPDFAALDNAYDYTPGVSRSYAIDCLEKVQERNTFETVHLNDFSFDRQQKILLGQDPLSPKAGDVLVSHPGDLAHSSDPQFPGNNAAHFEMALYKNARVSRSTHQPIEHVVYYSLRNHSAFIRNSPGFLIETPAKSLLASNTTNQFRPTRIVKRQHFETPIPQLGLARKHGAIFQDLHIHGVESLLLEQLVAHNFPDHGKRTATRLGSSAQVALATEERNLLEKREVKLNGAVTHEAKISVPQLDTKELRKQLSKLLHRPVSRIEAANLPQYDFSVIFQKFVIPNPLEETIVSTLRRKDAETNSSEAWGTQSIMLARDFAKISADFELKLLSRVSALANHVYAVRNLCILEDAVK